jgi:hypothetical protein
MLKRQFSVETAFVAGLDKNVLFVNKKNYTSGSSLHRLGGNP